MRRKHCYDRVIITELYKISFWKGEKYVLQPNKSALTRTTQAQHIRWGNNPIALRKAKIVYNFGLSECNRDKNNSMIIFLNFSMKTYIVTTH